MRQKFEKGDYVKVARNLGSSMSHFQAGCNAIVEYSFSDSVSDEDRDMEQYSLLFEDSGSSAWYYEHQLSLIEKGRLDLFYKWKQTLDFRRTIENGNGRIING